MHFDPKGIQLEQLSVLQSMVKTLRESPKGAL
jgi:hypothetical protein